MKGYLITFRSVTFAQKAQRAVSRAGFDCQLLRTPRALSGRGCGYCLRFRPDRFIPARAMLDAQGLVYQNCYGIYADGHMEAVGP